MRAVDGEMLFGHAIAGPVPHGDRRGRHRTLFGPVFVDIAVAIFLYGFEILIDGIDAAGGVHPAGALVETLVDEELPPRHGAVGIEPLLTGHLQFRATEKSGE